MANNTFVLDALNSEINLIIELMKKHNQIHFNQLLISEIDFKIKNNNQKIVIEKNIVLPLSS